MNGDNGDKKQLSCVLKDNANKIYNLLRSSLDVRNIFQHFPTDLSCALRAHISSNLNIDENFEATKSEYEDLQSSLAVYYQKILGLPVTQLKKKRKTTDDGKITDEPEKLSQSEQ